MPLRRWSQSPTARCWSNPNSKSAARCGSRLKIPVAASNRKISTECSVHSLRPKPMAWEWACRSAGRLSNRTVGVCGLCRVIPREQFFSSLCPPIHPGTNRQTAACWPFSSARPCRRTRTQCAAFRYNGRMSANSIIPPGVSPTEKGGAIRRLTSAAPGIETLLHYQFAKDFRHDLVAGISVAAVALPVAVAYAQLAGFNPVVGLYSSILPLVAYAIFGTSRQLMVNPDAATCAIIAAAITPLAAGNAELYLSLSIALTFLTGLICIVASFFRLGVLADFLSKPILVGFLNGIAISIFLGQAGKLLGFSIESSGIVPRLLEILTKLPLSHVATLAVGAASFAVLYASLRFLPRVPAALAVMVLAAAATWLLKLDAQGVAILGPVPAGLPPLRWPTLPLEAVPSVAADAAGLALVLFTSGVLTARSFALKGRYAIDVDREFAAFGVANIAAALSQGFAVTGADSRTAVADASGGRTQVTGLVAAASIAIVLLFLTGPLQYVPIPALGALLVYASLSLFNTRTLREFWRIDRLEVALDIVTTL